MKDNRVDKTQWMKTAPLIHTYKEIPDFNIIGERLFLKLEDTLRVNGEKH